MGESQVQINTLTNRVRCVLTPNEHRQSLRMDTAQSKIFEEN